MTWKGRLVTRALRQACTGGGSHGDVATTNMTTKSLKSTGAGEPPVKRAERGLAKPDLMLVDARRPLGSA